MRQQGFTLIELMVGVSLIAAVTLFALPTVNKLWDDGKYASVHNDVQILLGFMERARRTVASTSVSGSPRTYQHTYLTLSAGSTVSDLERLLMTTVPVKNTNAFNRAYSLEIGTHYSQVTTVLTGKFDSMTAVSRRYDGANTTLVFRSSTQTTVNMLRTNSTYHAKHLYLENLR